MESYNIDIIVIKTNMKTLKVPLHSCVVQNCNTWLRIQDAVVKVNKIVILTYQILRKWILFRLHCNMEISAINNKVVLEAMRVAKIERTSGKRRKPGDDMYPVYMEMKEAIGNLQHTCNSSKVERILYLEATNPDSSKNLHSGRSASNGRMAIVASSLK